MIWGSEVMLHGCKKQYNPFNSKIYLQQIFKYNKTYIFVKISFWKTSTRCHICNTNIFAKLNIPLNKNPFRQNNIKKLLFKSERDFSLLIQCPLACTKYCRGPHCNIPCRHYYWINWWRLAQWKWEIDINSNCVMLHLRLFAKIAQHSFADDALQQNSCPVFWRRRLWKWWIEDLMSCCRNSVIVWMATKFGLNWTDQRPVSEKGTNSTLFNFDSQNALGIHLLGFFALMRLEPYQTDYEWKTCGNIFFL